MTCGKPALGENDRPHFPNAINRPHGKEPSFRRAPSPLISLASAVAQQTSTKEAVDQPATAFRADIIVTVAAT